MNVLVLGGNGFIGSHIVSELLSLGHSVRVFDRTNEKYRAALSSVDYRLGSFDDLPCLAEALEGIDVVVHSLTTTVPSTSNLDPIADINGNLLATVRLLQFMVRMNCKKIIYLSSGGTIYGVPSVSPIPVTHELNPICSYGVVKLSVEKYLHMFHALHGINSIIFRVSNPYGERQGHGGVQGVVGTFLKRLQCSEPISIWGDGSVVRDYLYVGDVAKLFGLALHFNTTGVFNVGSGSGVSLIELISVMQSVTGKTAKVHFQESRSFDIPSVVLDIAGTSASFDWSCQTNLYEGIDKTWNWLNSLDR